MGHGYVTYIRKGINGGSHIEFGRGNGGGQPLEIALTMDTTLEAAPHRVEVPLLDAVEDLLDGSLIVGVGTYRRRLYES